MPQELPQLEPLVISLGLQDHMEPLSEFRDELLRAKATEIQELTNGHAAAIELAVATAVQEKQAEIDRLAPLEGLYSAMVTRVQQVLESGDPAEYEALARDFLADPKEKKRAELLAQLEALDS